MTSTIKEKIEVMTAFNEGKKIQAKLRGNWAPAKEPWQDCERPTWNWGTNEYRIKPKEPRVIYVNEMEPDQLGSIATTHVLASLNATRGKELFGHTGKVIKFIEVIENE